MSVSEYMRQTALKTEIKAALSIEDLEKTKSLFNIGNNLNQITKQMHQHGMENTIEEISVILNSLKQILKI